MLQTYWKPHSFIQQTFIGCPQCARDYWPRRGNRRSAAIVQEGEVCPRGFTSTDNTHASGFRSKRRLQPLQPWLVKHLRQEEWLQTGTGQEGWIWFSLGKKGNENTQNWTQTGHTKVAVAQRDREPGLSRGEQGSAWRQDTLRCRPGLSAVITHSVPSTWESCCSFPNNLTTGKMAGPSQAGGTGFMRGPGQAFQLWGQSWVQAELYHLPCIRTQCPYLENWENDRIDCSELLQSKDEIK